METKNTNSVILKDLDHLGIDAQLLFPPHSPRAGGLLLLWENDLYLQILNSNKHFIDTHISYKNSTFFRTFVYRSPEIPGRQAVWDILTTISDARDAPWILTRDFNKITYISEKSGDRDRSEISFSALCSFLSSFDLFDLKHRKRFFSWRGKSHTHILQCRLDRTLVNRS